MAQPLAGGLVRQLVSFCEMSAREAKRGWVDEDDVCDDDCQPDNQHGDHVVSGALVF